jgi:hypothetical protein
MFNTTFEKIKKNIFLYNSSDTNKLWQETDSKKNFKKNKKKLGDSWHYANKEVYYNFNSNGYRTKEFNNINWGESIVIFGCSLVFGVGLAEDETITYQLSKILKKNVINMGVPGSSVEFNLYNNLILKKGYPSPLAVVNLWTNIERTTQYNEYKVLDLGEWNFKQSKFDRFKNFILNDVIKNNQTCTINGYFNMLMTKLLWDSNKIEYYEASFFENTAKIHNIDFLSTQIVDQARDCLHPGPKTAKLTAEFIAKKLNV